MFEQTFDSQDIGVIALLVLLEGVLSIDNALVIALLAKRLPKEQRSKALTYGLVGAFAFRFVAIGAASFLLRWHIVKFLGGGYLVWVAVKHLWSELREKHHDHVTVDPEDNPMLVDDETGREITPEQEEEELKLRSSIPLPAKQPGFWATVAVIELTDIAFAVDSILAAIAIVGGAPPEHDGPHPKLWVVITGGILGVILMRFAATVFIRLLERYPRFETAAYLLVLVIGIKLLVDWGANTSDHPHRVDFHDPGSPAFWIFWVVMVVCIGIGFVRKRPSGVHER
jgi:YkoY family integral membrane protein